MIKYNSNNINDWDYNSNPIKKVMYNGRKAYQRFVANGSPTPPAFQGKWLATYSDSHTESAQCGSSSAITQNDINKTNLVSIEIGDCVTIIGDNAFRGCSGLTSIEIPSGVTSIGQSAFNGCSSLTSIDIPNSVTSIGDYAFYGCSGLTSIDIPNGVTSIGDYAFQFCSGLTSINIPNSVTSIGGATFRSCTSLTSIVIPSGVTFIGDRTFQHCSGLTSITVEATSPPALDGRYAFATNYPYFDRGCPIYVPDASVNAYKAATNWSYYTSRIKPISEKP